MYIDKVNEETLFIRTVLMGFSLPKSCFICRFCIPLLLCSEFSVAFACVVFHFVIGWITFKSVSGAQEKG